MVSIWIAIVLAVGLAGFAILLNHVDPGQPRPWMRAMVGVAPGVAGAFIVGTLATDLVPDGLEQSVTPLVIVLATAAIIGLTVLNLSRR
jgi:hypothetical protein